MYTILILFAMVVIPLPFMRKTVLYGKNPYHGVLRGVFASIVAIMIIFVLMKVQTGMGMADIVDKAFHDMMKVQDPEQFLKTFGVNNITEEEFVESLEQMIRTMRMMIPASIIVWSLIIAYVEYSILTKIVSKCGIQAYALPPFRLLTLPKSSLIGAVIIYLLAYLTGVAGFIGTTMIMLNIQIILDFIFSVQGLAVVFYYTKLKGVPRIITILICVILFLLNIGQILFFLLGLTEVAFQLRRRFKQKRA